MPGAAICHFMSRSIYQVGQFTELPISVRDPRPRCIGASGLPTYSSHGFQEDSYDRISYIILTMLEIIPDTCFAATIGKIVWSCCQKCCCWSLVSESWAHGGYKLRLIIHLSYRDVHVQQFETSTTMHLVYNHGVTCIVCFVNNM